MSACKPCETKFWGNKHTITPILINKKLGDGKQIIAFQPLNTRPNFYIICVDSSWNVDNHLDDVDHVYEHCDEICAAIEEEYGTHREYKNDFPALADDCGTQWWAIEDIDKYLKEE